MYVCHFDCTIAIGIWTLWFIGSNMSKTWNMRSALNEILIAYYELYWTLNVYSIDHTIAIEIIAYWISGSPINLTWLIGLVLKNTQPNDISVMKINRLWLAWLINRMNQMHTYDLI